MQVSDQYNLVPLFQEVILFKYCGIENSVKKTDTQKIGSISFTLKDFTITLNNESSSFLAIKEPLISISSPQEPT